MPRKSAPATTPATAPSWPALPTTVDSVTGSVAVVRELLPNDEAEGEVLLGCYDRSRREIRIAPDLVGEPAWYTFFHELVHVWIDDAGAPWDLEMEEHVCRLIGSALTAQAARGLGIA